VSNCDLQTWKEAAQVRLGLLRHTKFSFTALLILVRNLIMHNRFYGHDIFSSKPVLHIRYFIWTAQFQRLYKTWTRNCCHPSLWVFTSRFLKLAGSLRTGNCHSNPPKDGSIKTIRRLEPVFEQYRMIFELKTGNKGSRSHHKVYKKK
jgi:hypothetical protein